MTEQDATLIVEQQDKVALLRLNKPQVHNAFDDELVQRLLKQLKVLDADPDVAVVMLAASGKHFCAGADLNWMQRMIQYTEEENAADALQLAELFETLYSLSKPTVALVQGAVLGGGVGLVACCDMVIAAEDVSFCFSEIKLGLVPAVVSPYVVKSLGERMANYYFLSAENMDAERAYQLGLVHQVVSSDALALSGELLAQRLVSYDKDALKTAKSLVRTVAQKPIDASLHRETAAIISRLRVSESAQKAMHGFLGRSKMSKRPKG